MFGPVARPSSKPLGYLFEHRGLGDLVEGQTEMGGGVAAEASAGQHQYRATPGPQGAANYSFPSTGSKDDPLVNINAKEERTKEGWIKIMAAREARNDLRECYRREGNNHVDRCAQFAKAYLNAINQPFFSGGMSTRLHIHEK